MYAFFIFDIDNFKKVNDQLGHEFGDYCIREFTGIVRSHFDDRDILGRIGGDEFVAFAEVPDMDSVRRKAGELTRSLDTVIEYQDMKWNISASIGVAVYPSGGLQFVELYRNADRALYQTKKRGKNGFTIHKPVIPAE